LWDAEMMRSSSISASQHLSIPSLQIPTPQTKPTDPMKILSTDLHILTLHNRLPFRYGIATMTAVPHLFVRLLLEVDGREQWGIAAESLAPKWFTKNPDSSFRDEIDDMLAVIRTACDYAQSAGEQATVFDLWQRVYQQQSGWAAATPHPPLLWGLGPALVERALIDAFCRAIGQPFAKTLAANRLGIRLDAIHPELAGLVPADLLPAKPLERVSVRHTIGLIDPLTDDEIAPADRQTDGLPHSLAANINTYGLTRFKLKIGGNVDADRARLAAIARLLDERGIDYRFTLDGNEQYHSVADFRILWEGLNADPALAPFLQRLIFVEQPLHRDVALSEETATALLTWDERPPLIIDESDATLESARIALASGYVGTSHKNCKGVFKGIANACLIRHRQKNNPTETYILSCEDLSNVGPVALLQDLAVIASLGIGHAERNGHHYFAGLSHLPAEQQAALLSSHGDLYRQHTTADGRSFPSLAIENGSISVASVVDAPFGLAAPFDPSIFPAASEWSFASLGLGG
jgi:L-alanine-DL-glutamate epimerase-like enolase superfamily enzyme